MEKIDPKGKEEFFSSFDGAKGELIRSVFRFLYQENGTIFFTLEANDEEIKEVRTYWAQIKSSILKNLRIANLSYINEIAVDELFLSKLITVCGAKKVELVSSLNKAS